MLGKLKIFFVEKKSWLYLFKAIFISIFLAFVTLSIDKINPDLPEFLQAIKILP